MAETRAVKYRTTLPELWRDALTEANTFVIHQALSAEPNRTVTHTVSSALRTAMKMAASFQAETGHPPGTRVAILSDGFGDVFPFYHAMWLLGMTVVTIPSNLSPVTIATHLNEVEAKVLVYSPSQMARLAKIVPHVSQISHRIVCGEVRAKDSVAGSGSLSFQDLLQNRARMGKLEDFERPAQSGAPPALIAFTEGKYEESVGIVFSMRALLAAAENQSWVYFRDSDAERIVSLLPSQHIVSLVHTLLVPLVARIMAFDISQCDSASRSWDLVDELIDNQITVVLTNEDHLEQFVKMSKTNRFSLSKDFRLLLLPANPVESHRIEAIKDLIVPCYGLSEAGGLVSVGTKGRLYDCNFSSVHRESTFVAGTPLGGVAVRVVDGSSEVSKANILGEILVQSEQVMSRYYAPTPSRTRLGPEHRLFTGDRGAWFIDGQGRVHISILGRERCFFRRNDLEINMRDIETAIRKVIGVRNVRIIPFPHQRHGQELAAFVVVSAQHKSSVTREGLWRNLLRFFPWEVVPKVFIIADERQITAMPSRSILLEKLVAFSSVDFSKRPPL